ncbi:hypothetical protein ABW20_dc0102628 [Dactylellina cionopaga]|nr:hypothetical protein ABW20_dc0102628 [Dactylellina cionopaga]
MKWNNLLSLVVAFSASGVLSTPVAAKPKTPTPTPDTLSNSTVPLVVGFDACEQAENCEVYEDPRYGTSTRFKKGTEPGTAAYNKTIGRHKHLGIRAAPFSGVNVGKNRVNYGTENPYDVVRVMWDACQEFGCGNSGIFKNTKRVAPLVANGYWGTEVHWYSMIVYNEGHYSTWDQRNRMINTVLTMVQIKQEWKQVNWQKWQYNGQNAYSAGSGSLWEGTQSDYFQVDLYQYQGGPMLAQLKVFVGSDYSEPTRGDCNLIFSMLTQILDRVVPVLGTAVGILQGATCGY